MKKVKLIVELAFIFLLPLLFIALTCSIKTVKEYDENNNEINKESYIESSYPFSDFKNDNHYINTLNFNNNIVVNNNLVNQGLTPSIDDNDIITLSGISNTTYSNITQGYLPIVNHKYYIKMISIANPNNISFYWSFFNAGYNSIGSQNIGNSWIIEPYYVSNSYTGIQGFTANTDFNNVKFKVLCCDLTLMFGAGFEPSLVDCDIIFNNLDIDIYSYTVSEEVVYYSDIQLSSDFIYNYSPWGSFIHLVIDYLYLADTPLLRILLMYFIMFMIMFLLWHVVYLPIDWIVHLGTKPLKE